VSDESDYSVVLRQMTFIAEDSPVMSSSEANSLRAL